MMIKRICPLLAMALLAFSAEARQVNSDEAALVARAWISRGRGNTRLGVKFPSAKADATAVHTTESDAIFYTVKMSGGGTIFLSGDTAFEPVIGFTSATDDFSTIDVKSPLWALLNRDVSRMKTGKKLKLTTSSATTASTAQGNDAKWAALIAEGQELDKPRLSTLSAAKHNPPDDLRVPNLVESQWSQRNVGEKACYNYFTPNGTDPAKFDPGSTDNAVCGCVATAMSQVMRYFKYPTAPVTPETHECTYNDESIELTMQGGIYEWDRMTLRPAEEFGITEDNRKAIGKLTSDAGIAAWMNYTPSSSGAYLFEGAQMMHDVFGYANVVTYDNWSEESRFIEAGGKIRAEALERTMFANFDAGKPVLVSIPGHAVLADGYGYDESGVDYVHFNMGWSGQSDYWYNIPDLTEAGEGFDAIEFISYNIFTNDAETCAVMSGRVVDDDETPIADAAITIYDAESQQIVRETATNDRGIWSAILEKGLYDVEARQGRLMSELSDVELTCPNTYSGGYSEHCAVTMTTPTTPSGLGNSWGNDMVLAEPTVRIVRDVGGIPETNLFTTLDKALGAVHENDWVEILLPTRMKKPVTVVSNCTIVATNEDAAVSYITRSPGAVLTIADGAEVMLSNLVFTASTETPVIVEEGGCLRLNEKVDLGIDYDHIAVSTAAKGGFDLAGALTRPTVIHCDEATGEEDVFGTYSCDRSVAMACANRLICADDPDHELRGDVIPNGTMIWKRTSDYPVEESAGYFVDEAGKTNAYYRMERALAQFRDAYTGGRASEFVVRTNGLFDVPFDVDKPLAICGEEGVRPELTVAVTSRFDVVESGSLAFSNIVFVGSAPVNEVSEMIFIRVNGGELTLGDGAEIRGFTGRVAGKSGVIDLLKGTATMKSGAVIRECKSVGTGKGGAIYVSCNKDCTLNLEGGTITDCRSATFGGGVYVYNYNEDYSPLVNVSGDLVVAGNRSANAAKDDIYFFSNETPDRFRLAGELDGLVGVWYSGSCATGNAEGDAFITSAISDGASEKTLYSFFNDTQDGMIAAEGAGAQAGMLVWVKDPRDPRQCEESEAAARLIAGGTTNYWREVSDALSVATNNCIVEVMAHGTDPVSLSDSVVLVGTNITLCSDSDVAPAIELMRGQDVRIVVPVDSELVVTNLDICGYDPLSAEWATNTVTLFDVNGGELTLDNVGIRYLVGDGKRNANAITVYNGGTLWMKGFSRIDTCSNVSPDPTDVKLTDAGAGGAILVDHATAHLVDTTIDGCEAWKGGGVFVCNGSTLHLSGETQITNNFVVGKLDACNIEFSEDSSLVLEGALSNRVGVTSLDNSVVYPGDTNRVAAVGYTWESDFTSLTNSAASFRRDGDGDVGVAVTNKTDELTTALIVWSTALKDGQYVDPRNGRIYLLAGEMPAPLEKANPEQPVAPKATAITILNVKPVDGGLAITVLATEGGNAVAVTPEQVTGLFEATTDLGDWTTKKVSLTVESSDQNADGTTTFTVKPAGNPNTAFIRLVQ